MEASNNIIYAVVINEANYLGSIEVIDKDFGHLVKFELKENNHQSEQVITRKFTIIKCDSYVANSGPNILVLDGYSGKDTWLFTLQCELNGKLTYHKYQQPEVLAEDNANQPSETLSEEDNYRDNANYLKARKILAMDDNGYDDGTIIDTVDCDQEFLNYVYELRKGFPANFFEVTDVNLAVRDHFVERGCAVSPTSAPDINLNDNNYNIILDMIRKINTGITDVHLGNEFPLIRSIVCMVYNAYNKVLLAKQNLSINKDTNAYQPHMVSDTMLVQHTIVSIYEDEMLPHTKRLIENGATVPNLSTSVKISTHEATWMIWFAVQYKIIVGKYGFSLRLSDYRYSDDASKRQAILYIHKISSGINASIGLAYSIAKTSGLDVDLIKMVANVCIANNLQHSKAANTPQLFTVIVRIIYHDVMSVNLKDLIRRGKSVAEITAEIPDAYNCRYLEWMIWFVKQYDEAIKEPLEPKDEENILLNIVIKRLNALQ